MIKIFIKCNTNKFKNKNTMMILLFYIGYAIVYLLSVLSSINYLYPFNYNILWKEFFTISLTSMSLYSIFDFGIDIFYQQRSISRIFKKLKVVLIIVIIILIVYSFAFTVQNVSHDVFISILSISSVLFTYTTLIIGWSLLFKRLKKVESNPENYKKVLFLGQGFILMFLGMIFITFSVLMSYMYIIFSLCAWITFSLAMMRFYKSIK